MTGIAYNAKLTEADHVDRAAARGPEAEGQGHAAHRDGGHARPRDARERRRPDQGHRRDVRRARSTAIQEAVDSGQIRQFTGNDYAGPLAKGDLVAAIAWSGDVVQLQADNPNLKWGIPEDGGMIWTDNMLIPTGGDVFTASTYMNYVYDPKIAAQIAAYVNYITPVQGREGGAAKIDPELAENPLIFPTDATLAKVHRLRLRRRSTTRTTTSSGRTLLGALGRTRAAMSFFHRHRGLTPYLLLAPGIAWLAIFFVVPLGFLGVPVAPAGIFPATRSPGRSRNYRDALSDYREQFVRSFGYAGIATVLALADQLPARVLDRVPRRAVEEPASSSSIIAPFFVTYLIRTLAWQTILSDDGTVVGILQDARAARRRRPAARDVDGRRRRASPTTTCPSWSLPLYVALEQIDPRLIEAAEDLYASPRAGVPAGDAAALAAGRRSRARC